MVCNLYQHPDHLKLWSFLKQRQTDVKPAAASWEHLGDPSLDGYRDSGERARRCLRKCTDRILVGFYKVNLQYTTKQQASEEETPNTLSSFNKLIWSFRFPNCCLRLFRAVPLEWSEKQSFLCIHAGCTILHFERFQFNQTLMFSVHILPQIPCFIWTLAEAPDMTHSMINLRF